MSIKIDLRVADESWNAIAALEAVCQRALDAGAQIGGTVGEISLLLTGDAEMQALNRDWRKQDKPTDVLSFQSAPEDRPFLGDIAVSIGVGGRDAEIKAIPMDQHLSHLLIHAYLHLIGHNHIDATEAEEMESLEIAALASLGWPDPYK